MAGDLVGAGELFGQCANSKVNDWCALANLARISERLNDFPDAIEKYSMAAGMASDVRIASELHYEAARLLSEQHSFARARSILEYALDLDGSNYKADALLRHLEASE
jgi:tetratricopeptide (TPR) repeat protein